MRRGPYGSALPQVASRRSSSKPSRATQTPEALLHESGETSSEGGAAHLGISLTKFTSPRLGEQGLVLELLLSDTGKPLRLYITNGLAISTFRLMQSERRSRVDAAEIEALHGMHLCQRPPAVPRRCVTFRPCQRPARRG